jgi:hypothetical protein
MLLCDVNRLLGLHKEGIQRAKEALEIYERLGKITEQAQCLNFLAVSLEKDEQLDAAEEAGSRQSNFSWRKATNFSSVDPIAFLAIYIPPRAR